MQVMLEEQICMSGFIGRERFAHKRQHVFEDLMSLRGFGSRQERVSFM